MSVRLMRFLGDLFIAGFVAGYESVLPPPKPRPAKRLIDLEIERVRAAVERHETEIDRQGIVLKATRGLIAGAPGWHMITDLVNGPPGTKALTWTRAGWLQTGSYAECSMADADTTFVFEELEEQVDAALDALEAMR